MRILQVARTGSNSLLPTIQMLYVDAILETAKGVTAGLHFSVSRWRIIKIFQIKLVFIIKRKKKNSVASECEHRLSLKLVPTFGDIRCHVVSVTDPYGHIFGFLDRCRYFSIK
jgi:hypothetical protein